MDTAEERETEHGVRQFSGDTEKSARVSLLFFCRLAPAPINKQSVKVLFCENVPNKDSLRAAGRAAEKRGDRRGPGGRTPLPARRGGARNSAPASGYRNGNWRGPTRDGFLAGR